MHGWYRQQVEEDIPGYVRIKQDLCRMSPVQKMTANSKTTFNSMTDPLEAAAFSVNKIYSGCGIVLGTKCDRPKKTGKKE